MASARRLLLDKFRGLSLDPHVGRRPENFLFPKTRQSPQLSPDVLQILKRGAEKSAFSGDWKYPLVDQGRLIVDQFNLVKIIPKLTDPVFINNSNSISKFLLERVLNTTETSFRHQIDSPNVPLGKDTLPITSPAVYFHLLNYFSRTTFKAKQTDHLNIYQIIHKMNVNNVKLNIDMINLLISNQLGSSNILARFQLMSNFNRPSNFYDPILVYLSILEKLGLRPNVTTLFLIYLSLPIDSSERSELRKFIISNKFNNSKQWTDIAFLESIRCHKHGKTTLGLEVLQSIPFFKNYNPKTLTLSTIRKSFLNMKYRTPLTFTSFISCQASSGYSDWLLAIKIVNGVCTATKTNHSTSSSKFNKYFRYSIHERYRPSLAGSIGTLIIPKALEFGSWFSLVKLLNWCRHVENGKLSWSVVQKSLHSLIHSDIEPVMKLILFKYMLSIIPSDSIIVSKRWDKLYWEIQDCIDYEFNKNAQLWGDSRMARSQRTSAGLQSWLSKLKSFNPYKSTDASSPASFSSVQLLRCRIESPIYDMDEKLLHEVNNLNLKGDSSYLNDLMTLDLSTMTKFESLLIDELRELKLFDADGELSLPKADPNHKQELQLDLGEINDPILSDLKSKLEVKINDFESNYWFTELLTDTHCSWLADQIGGKLTNND